MTTTIPQSKARFDHEIIQHSAQLSPLAQAIAASPESALESFNVIRQTIAITAPDVVMRRRNELARSFNAALQNHDWSLENSQKAVPVMNWLLGLKQGQVGGYIHIIRPMVDLACRKLAVTLNQRRAWKKVVAQRPFCCPKGIGKQAVDAYPRPSLRDVLSK